MPQGVVTVAYIGATILFILALGGLSHPETARRGNLYGMTGMAIALLATIFGVVTTITAAADRPSSSAAPSASCWRARADDADARARRDPAQPRRAGRGVRRLRQFFRSGHAFRRGRSRPFTTSRSISAS